jgi:hypothetical protein
MFRYVFGGAIDTPGTRYVDYLMPGIFVQTAAFAGITTAVGLATDLKTGIVDRLRSLPMAPWVVLAGRSSPTRCARSWSAGDGRSRIGGRLAPGRRRAAACWPPPACSRCSARASCGCTP